MSADGNPPPGDGENSKAPGERQHSMSDGNRRQNLVTQVSAGLPPACGPTEGGRTPRICG
jgi:hypothetical protein